MAVTNVAYRYEPGCSGKWPYANPTLAWKVAKRKNQGRKRHDDTEGPVAVYRCSGCGVWHIGHEAFK